MSALRIIGGAVYDPAHDVHGEVRDVCIEDGRIVPSVGVDARVIDAQGMVVMAGGVDIHSHVAGSGVNLARKLSPEEHDADPVRAPRLLDGRGRSGTGGTVPSTFTTGYRYAGLGYTTVFDAAVAPLMARSAHADLDDTPVIDGGFFVLAGNDEFLLRLLASGDTGLSREYLAWLLGASGAYALKVVNPGGIELWKQGWRGPLDVDAPLGSSRITPRTITEALVDAASTLGLPHAAHIHCNNLGMPGNVRTTRATMEQASGRRAHFTHLQFHCYDEASDGGRRSGAREIAEFVNAHPELTGDVGQVMFGPATTLSADGPAQYLLSKSAGRTWSNVDIELETGCGLVPHHYRERSAVAALQWAIGLELFLLSQDPWRMVLSTDHPNGGSFMAYPALIRLLMDRTWRDEQLSRVNARLLEGSALADGLDREYTLSEVAIITRAGPARILGLQDKGHLGIGADGDVTVYSRASDAAAMFEAPRYVIKAGTVVVDDGELRRAPSGRRLWIRPEYDRDLEPRVRAHFERYATVSFDNYPVSHLDERDRPRLVRR
jgi:formylmethanofuran dehydrogenase subunit A